MLLIAIQLLVFAFVMFVLTAATSRRRISESGVEQMVLSSSVLLPCQLDVVKYFRRTDHEQQQRQDVRLS